MTERFHHDEMPPRIRELPRDSRGYPIPWFVETLEDGARDFRIASAARRVKAVKQRLCWICGGKLGVHFVFVIGPMCAVNRVTSEPSCHVDCAHFSVRACPFLTRPMANYRDSNMPVPKEDLSSSGLPIKRNPGVTCLYRTPVFRPFDAGNGWLIQLGEATAMEFWREGRLADEAEVRESVVTGLPFLEEEAIKQGPEAMKALSEYVDRFERMWLRLRRQAA